MKIFINFLLVISLFFTFFLEASEINNQNLKNYVNQYNEISNSKKKIIEFLKQTEAKNYQDIDKKWDDKKINLPKLEFYNDGFKTVVKNGPVYFNINNNYELVATYKGKSVALNETMSFDDLKFQFSELMKNSNVKTSLINLLIPNAHAVAVIDDLVASAIALSVIALVTFGSSYYLDYKNNKARNEKLQSANNLAKTICSTLNNATPEQVLSDNLIEQYNEFAAKLNSLCTKEIIENNVDRKEICSKSLETKKCIKNAIDKSRAESSSRGSTKKFDFDSEKDQYQKSNVNK